MKHRRPNYSVRVGVAIILGLCFVSGCSTTSTSPRPGQYPSSVQHWNGIDAVEFLHAFRAEDYSRLLVEPLDTSHTSLPPKDENTYEPTLAVLREVDGIVLAALAHEWKGQFEVSLRRPDTALPGNSIVLRARLAEINPGSRAARFWVGFGAGSGWVKIDGEILDAQTQKALLKFEQRRVSAMGGEYKAMLTACAGEIGGDIGRLIILSGAK